MSEPIDLDELEYPARVSRDSGFKSVNLSIDVAMAMIEELRQSRARVAELEVADKLWGDLLEKRGDKLESAEARVKELESRLASLACPMPGCDGDIGCVLHGAMARVKELEAAIETISSGIGYKPLGRALDTVERLAQQVDSLNRNLNGEIAEHERHHVVEAELQARAKELEAENVRLRESIADAWAEGCAWISIFSADGGK